MKRLGVMLLMLMLMLSMAFAMSGKSGEPPGTVISEQGTVNSVELLETAPTVISEQGTVNSVELLETAPTVNERIESAATMGKAGEPPGGKISPAIDNVVTVTIIPLLVLVIGLLRKSFDKNRFTMLLLQLWGLIKDADNFFAFPDAAQKRLIEANGINAAKKLWVAEQAVKSIRQEDVTYLKKKTGSLGNAIELAINIFKTGAGAISLGKKVISVFK